MHPEDFGLIATMFGTGGAGDAEPWHLEYIAVASLILAGVVGLVTIWKHAANDFVRKSASGVVVLVVVTGVFLAMGPMNSRLTDVRQRIVQLLSQDASILKGSDGPSLGSGNGRPSLGSGNGRPSLGSGNGGPSLGSGSGGAEGTPLTQQYTRDLTRQYTPLHDASPASRVSATEESPTATPQFGGSISNPGDTPAPK